jgi:hypothetical protein
MRRLPKIRSCITVICIMTLLSALFPSSMLLAKEKKTLNWDNVLKLRVGDLIAVKLFSKETYVGKVDRVEPNSIALTTQEDSLLIPRDKIKKIQYTKRPKAAGVGLIMMLGGAGLLAAGAVVGAAKDYSDVSSGNLSGSTGKHGESLYVAGAVLAVAGTTTLILGGKSRIIYEAKANTQAANN